MTREEAFADLAAVFRDLSPRAQAVLGYATICCAQTLDNDVEVSHLCDALNLSEDQWDAVLSELKAATLVWQIARDSRTYNRISTYPSLIMATYAIAPTNRPRARDWQMLRERVFQEAFNGAEPRCMYCDAADEPLVLDHVVPISRGGSNHPVNFLPACERCNSSKGAKTYIEWAAHRANRGRDGAH